MEWNLQKGMCPPVTAMEVMAMGTGIMAMGRRTVTAQEGGSRES